MKYYITTTKFTPNKITYYSPIGLDVKAKVKKSLKQLRYQKHKL